MALSHILQKGSSHANSLNIGYLPVFFRIRSHTDRQALQKLMESNPAIVVFDAIEGQLTELMKAANPTQRLSAGDLADAVKKHLGGVPPEEYGVWVYYPWSGRLVHILDEKEFIELRTSRNLYKITREEREILSKQKIGVIGLSVGQSIAVTMAMERTFGEIRLADFDTLELTNMNRIRTGLHNLGVSKVMLAAREIAEIDPFLKVVCFTEGITEDNIDDFLLKDGRLNILVDECDSLDVKIYARVRAKAHRIPVVMDTSDRGMVDIERFDLEPERQIFHGLISEFAPAAIRAMAPQERMNLVLSIIGKETLSERAGLSLSEVGKTITTWPQLASSVALGGATGTDICRRILLNQLHASGRYYVDLQKIISN
jgi:hypothetical protein